MAVVLSRELSFSKFILCNITPGTAESISKVLQFEVVSNISSFSATEKTLLLVHFSAARRLRSMTKVVRRSRQFQDIPYHYC